MNPAPYGAPAARPGLLDDLADVHRRAQPASVLLFVYAGFVALQLGLGIVAGLVMGPASYGLLDRMDQVGFPLQILLFIACAVVFVRWKVAAYRLLPELTGTDTEHEPPWAGWAYVVPILNLFRPFQIMRELWDGSEPSRLHVLLDSERDGRWMLGAWWGLWLCGGFLGRIGRAVERGNPAHDALWALQIGSTLLLAVAAVLAALIVRAVDAHQQARGTEVTTGDNFLAVPPSL